MDCFLIDGGHPLSGEISVFAAKNAVLPMIAGAILAKRGTTILHNIPNIADVRIMLEVVRRLGVKAEFDAPSHSISMNASSITSCEAEYELVKKMRASFMVMGPLLARMGMAPLLTQ